MDDQIQTVAAMLRGLQGKFDPATLSHVGYEPTNTLTMDQLNTLEEVVQDLLSVRRSLEERIRLIDECKPARMAELAQSNEIQAVTEFNLDAHQQAAFDKSYNGDNKDYAQQSASETATEKLTDLVQDAKFELQELHQLVDKAVQNLDEAI